MQGREGGGWSGDVGSSEVRGGKGGGVLSGQGVAKKRGFLVGAAGVPSVLGQREPRLVLTPPPPLSLPPLPRSQRRLR